MIKVGKWILALVATLILCLGLAACGGDDGDGGTTDSDTTAAQTQTTTDADDGADSDDGGIELETEPTKGPARSENVDEVLAMHPIFPTKRFLDFAARGNPDACSLLSDKGRRAMQRTHGKPCPEVIRSAGAERDEPGLMIAGEFVPVDDFSDIEFPTTIIVLDRERGRVTVGDEPRPMRLSRYGEIWLIDSIPLADIGTVR